MAEYIEREKALDVINLADFIADEHGLLLYADSAQARLLDIPSADVQPVVHGHWMELPDGFCRCSVCQKLDTISNHLKYCSNCGAKMS